MKNGSYFYDSLGGILGRILNINQDGTYTFHVENGGWRGYIDVATSLIKPYGENAPRRLSKIVWTAKELPLPSEGYNANIQHIKYGITP